MMHYIPFLFCVCATLFSKKGFDVKSYGTGSVVKLPGSRPDQPNVYEFGTTYQFMYEDLYRKDPHLYLYTVHWSLASTSCLLAKVVMAVACSYLTLFCVRLAMLWKCINIILTDKRVAVFVEGRRDAGTL